MISEKPYYWTRLDHQLWKFFVWWFWKSRPGSRKVVGTRSECTTRFAAWEIRLIIRDLSVADLYSREELFEMLAIIRESEERMHWKVPEPFKSGLRGVANEANLEG